VRPANGLAGFPQKRNAIVAPPLRSSGGGLGSGTKDFVDGAIDTMGDGVKKAADVLDDMSWDALLKGMIFTIGVGSVAYFVIPAGFPNLAKGVIGTGKVLVDSGVGLFTWTLELPAKAIRAFERAEA